MNGRCPRLVIAGTGSGVGKTSLALGICRALSRRGLRVQAFKVGPDFLDPTYLTMATARTCYNLDSWMSGASYVRSLFAEATATADIAVIEGVMGLFDGASASSLEGSTAEIARLLDAPVLLVCGAHGVARSLAATVKGFATLEEGVSIAGVIANHCGSSTHKELLAEALSSAGLPALVGAMPRGALAPLASRHLGLVGAEFSGCNQQSLDTMADAVQDFLDLEAILALSKDAGPLVADLPAETPSTAKRVRLGIARDAAFHFYYPDNLAALQRHGADLVEFSPLADSALPEGLDAVYFGGGYPEVHAAALADNTSMLNSVREFAATPRSIYAECGGLIYLGRTLATLDGQQHAMAGVLPIDTAMRSVRKVLGYAETAWTVDGPFGPAGTRCRGHEFHYSEISANDAAECGWRPAYSVRYRRAAADACGGMVKGRVCAGYVHLHWAASHQAVEQMISFCEPTS